MAGVEQRGGQPQPQQPRQAEQTQPLQGRAAGRESLHGPTTVDQSGQPQLGSTLSRAVEGTRDLYERNGWTFLPLGEAGQGAPSLPKPRTAQPLHGVGAKSPEPTLQKPEPLEQTRLRERTSYAGATFYSGVGLFDVLKKKEYYKKKKP
jgi:hypothetical protein